MTRSELIDIEHFLAKALNKIEETGEDDEDVKYYMGVVKSDIKDLMFALEDKAFKSRMNAAPYVQSDFI